MSRERELQGNPIFIVDHKNRELPDQIELPQMILEEATRLTNLTRTEGKEYSTTFQYRKDQLVQGKIHTGNEKSVRRGSTVKVLRSLFSHTMAPTLQLHTHPSKPRYVRIENRAEKIRVKIKSNRPIPPGLEELVRHILADRGSLGDEDRGRLPSGRDVANFLSSNLSASLVASEGAMVMMVKNRLVTFKEKLENDYYGSISRRLQEYEMALKSPANKLDPQIKLSRALSPFAVYYTSNPDVTPVLTKSGWCT